MGISGQLLLFYICDYSFIHMKVFDIVIVLSPSLIIAVKLLCVFSESFCNSITAHLWNVNVLLFIAMHNNQSILCIAHRKYVVY